MIGRLSVAHAQALFPTGVALKIWGKLLSYDRLHIRAGGVYMAPG
jgi:hypothetical protein